MVMNRLLKISSRIGSDSVPSAVRRGSGSTRSRTKWSRRVTSSAQPGSTTTVVVAPHTSAAAAVGGAAAHERGPGEPVAGPQILAPVDGGVDRLGRLVRGAVREQAGMAGRLPRGPARGGGGPPPP